MSLLILDNVKKHFGAQEVLRGASLQIDPGAKVGLVGRNGGGKTTLLRMIAGKEAPDWGSVKLRKGARLGTVPQRPQFDPGVTVRQYVESGMDAAKGVLHELEQIAEKMGASEPAQLERLMKEHDRLTEELEVLGGWETERRIETVLSGIGLAEEFWDREARTLSGGEKSRTALARELVAGHDLLLLDEPTNHLDLQGIEWIERYIKELKGAVFVVSHDRRLLDNVVESILELEFGALTRYPGNYSRYVEIKEERFETDLRAYEAQADFIRKEESFIKKHMGSQRTAEAKGRQKKLGNIERLVQPHHDVRRPVIQAPEAARGGELVLETEQLTGGFDGNCLFENVRLRIGRGQRIGIVGPNGAGKTTLMKILANRMTPLAGEVHRGHGSVVGYYDQDTSHLREDGTPLTELLRVHPELTDLQARSHLALFLFRGGEVEKSVSALSGGERARLALARLVLSRPSWLALDEPTNHLDLAGRTALEEMLGTFAGTIVCISHDREFLDGLCDHIVEVGGGTVREFEGNYTAWRVIKDAETESATQDRARVKKEERARERKAAERQAAPKKKQKNESRGQAKGGGGRGKVRNPYMFDKLEKRIMQLEESLKVLHAQCLDEEVYRDSAKLRDTQIEIAEVEHELALANEEWASWE